MFCGNCGKQNKPNAIFCEACGSRMKNNYVRPIVTNVGYDDTLPKNSNFVIVLILIISLVASITIYLAGYKSLHDYKHYVMYEDFKVYLPVGYANKIEDGAMYIYNDTLAYIIKSEKDNFKVYYENNFELLQNALLKENYKILESPELLNKNKTILVHIKYNDEDAYFFIHNFDENIDQVFYGYVKPSGEITSEEKNTLFEILSRIE